MKRRLGILLVVLLLVGMVTSTAAAQSYSFSLPQEVVNLFINTDGTYSIDYVFIFKNDAGAPPIQYVDVGMPNGNFNRDSITADINGKSASISTDYQGSGSGFAVDLGSNAIPAGQMGKVHVYVGIISDVIYPDDNDPNYVSTEFSPTWFDSGSIHGNTDLTMVFHLPQGVKPEEGRYHIPRNWVGADEPATALDNLGRVTYTWRSADADGSTQYYFGASFPKQYVPAQAIVIPAPFKAPSIDSDTVIGFLFCCGFAFFFLGLPVLGVFSERKRKLQYLSPKISIEGHGIKRGLTAVEAAILMQEPLDKVMTMILFGVVKKGAAEVITRDPLSLKVIEPPASSLHDYEQNFVDVFKFTTKPEQRKALQKVTVDLIKSVEEKMRGFSRKETVDYYKSIMERAWQQVEASDTPEVKSKMFDEALEWTMLDKDFDDRTRRTFTGPVFVPSWWGHYDPTWHTGSSAGGSGSGIPSIPSSGQSGGLPGSAFAASVVGGVQSFSSGLMGNLGAFTSGVTNVTNPPPPPSRSSGSRSGGGCACACACAGCACACAGGGR